MTDRSIAVSSPTDISYHRPAEILEHIHEFLKREGGVVRPVNILKIKDGRYKSEDLILYRERGIKTNGSHDLSSPPMYSKETQSRPSLEQVIAIVDFMEKHPALALGQMRGLEKRDECKKLWFRLTRIVNNLEGPDRPLKSWVKYWADKKSTIRSKVQSNGGDPNTLSSNIEKKIWDLFLANDVTKDRGVKQESHYTEEFYNEDSVDRNLTAAETVLTFKEPVQDIEERQMIVMEKLVRAMGEQATAMTQLAHATHVGARAMDRLADASQIQARAIERLANSFESIGASTHDVRNAIVEIDSTMKRFYSTSPT